MQKNDMIYTFRVKAGMGAKVHIALSKLGIYGPITVQFIKPKQKRKRKTNKKLSQNASKKS
jgi:hypothetical protein